MWCDLSDQARGTIYCVVAILILTPDSLCVRLLGHMPNFAVIFYRYILYASIMIVVHVAKEGKNALKSFLGIGWIGALCGLVWGTSCITITYAFQITAVANVLVINSASPMFSAIFSWILLKERIPTRTIVTSLVAFIAIILIFSEQLNPHSTGSNKDLLGLFLSIIASSTMGLYFVLLRFATGPKGEDIDMIPCNIIAALFVSLVCICVSQEKGAIYPTDLMIIMYNGMFMLPVSFALLTVAPSLISASEVALLSLGETVLAPIIVWLGGFEAPPEMAIYGGAILIVALAIHSYLGIREEKTRKVLMLHSREHSFEFVATARTVAGLAPLHTDVEMDEVTQSPIWNDDWKNSKSERETVWM